MMKDILVGEDTIDLVVDVNGCRVFAAVFCFCCFLRLFCAWRLFLGFGRRDFVLWKKKTSPPRRLMVVKDEWRFCVFRVCML